MENENTFQKSQDPDEESFKQKHEEQKLQNQNIQNIQQLQKSLLQLCFVIDVTGSMEAYVCMLQKSLFDILNLFKKQDLNDRAQIGFVFYRDLSENDPEFNKQMKQYKPVNWQPQPKIEIIDFSILTEESTQENGLLYEYLNDLTTRCDGGDDYAEDIAGAFAKMLELSWLPVEEKTIKIAVLITDAPCHGKEFHDNVIDNYPDLKKMQDLDIRPQLDKMMEKKINLSIIEINPKTQKMVYEIEKYYKNKDKPHFLQSLKLVDDLNTLSKIKIVNEDDIQNLTLSLLEKLEVTMDYLYNQ